MRHAEDELVWIDGKGVAHPLGDNAIKRMRAREGAFRLLPTPDHLVFMRFTGEDGRRDAEDGAIVRMAGEIVGPGVMGDVLALIASSGWRGELVVRDGARCRGVFFEHGNIVGARTDVDEESLGSLLFRYGLVDEEQLASILARIAHGERFGAAAVALGFVSEAQVFEHLQRQIDEVVHSMLLIADGAYCFLDGFEEASIGYRRTVPALSVLMSATARLDEMRYFRARIPSGEHVPERIGEIVQVDPELAPLWPLINGRRSVEELGRLTGLGDFEVTKQIYRLVQAKAVTITAPRFRGGVGELVETANVILVRIHQEADLAGRGTSFRTTLASFAQGRFGRLIVGAGPFEDGSFGGRRLAANAVALVGEDEAYAHVAELLHDYASFALFSLGTSVDSRVELGVSREVEAQLCRLRPQSSSSQLIRLTDVDEQISELSAVTSVDGEDAL
ncbi:MAG: DUF4388 domain-containing protein [Nannocystis sp.]|nr:DUF4388 domain-containing protein [Nannocystis sp.]